MNDSQTSPLFHVYKNPNIVNGKLLIIYKTNSFFKGWNEYYNKITYINESQWESINSTSFPSNIVFSSSKKN